MVSIGFETEQAFSVKNAVQIMRHTLQTINFRKMLYKEHNPNNLIIQHGF